MRRSGIGKRLALAIAVALLGNGPAGALAPAYGLPEPTVHSVASHEQRDAESAPAEHTDCAGSCAASASCSSVGVLLPAVVTDVLDDEGVVAAPAQILTIPTSITSLPESPPPRA